MNLINFLFGSSFVILVFGYDYGSSYVTKAEHIIPSSNYHQQDHHENSELNQEIYVHESNNNDDEAHTDEYGFSPSQKDSNRLYVEKSPENLRSVNQRPDYSHSGIEHSYGSEASGNLHTAHQEFEHFYGNEPLRNSQDSHQNFGHSFVNEQNSHSVQSIEGLSHEGDTSGKIEESHSNDGNSQNENSSHDDHKDFYHHPSYKYEYGVHDPKTKDRHSQWEHRDGDVVKGEYTLDEPDGTIRKVSYSSDKHTGFTAHVERIGHAVHPESYNNHFDDASDHEKVSDYTSSDGQY